MYLRHADLNKALRVHEEYCLYRFTPPIATCPQVDPSPDCPKCPAYCDLVADTLAKLQGIFEYADATQTAAQNQYETDMKQAQGLYILHEAVLKKEMKTPAPASDMLTSGIPIQLAMALF